MVVIAVVVIAVTVICLRRRRKKTMERRAHMTMVPNPIYSHSDDPSFEGDYDKGSYKKGHYIICI